MASRARFELAIFGFVDRGPIQIERPRQMVPGAGIEPANPTLSGWCFAG